jgi:hypothetical protein
MELFRILRIAVLIACIFVAGIATGRFTTPSIPPEEPAQFSGTAGRVITPRMVMLYFDQRLQLEPRQKQAVLAEAQTFVREIAQTEPATQERFDIFNRYYPRVRGILRPDQLATFDALVKSHQERMAEILK